MTDAKPLSTRHERFVQEYLKDGNATRAYIRAGYSARGAQSCASRLLARPQIEAAVAAGRQRLAEALEISVQRLGQEYAKIAFASVEDFVAVDDDGRLRIDLVKASQAQQAGIVDLTVTEHGANHGKPWQRVRLKLGKLQALAALTRHVGLFTKKPEPGLTPEDRERYQATIARHERNWEHSLNELRRLTRERDSAQIALAAAQAKLAAAARSALAEAEAPPPEAEAPPQEPQPLQSMATPQTHEEAHEETQGEPHGVSADMSVVPLEKLIWRTHHHPGTISSAEALRRMKSGGFPGR